VFITFEGTEGSGKSLQSRRLAAHLRGVRVAVLETHEPGGTPLGDEVRHLLLSRDELAPTARVEALLMNASRAQLVEAVIRPALQRGQVVISDRFADSTLAYQGAGRGLDLQALAPVISFATAGLQPDMTILLDVPVEVGLARKNAQDEANRFEAETIAFHERVRSAFLALAASDPARWCCFDARRDPDVLSEDIWTLVRSRIGSRSV
jgi:dTMP kinase